MKTIAVPFTIDPNTGGVAEVTTTRKAVEQQIIDILSTSTFERVMNSTYGGNVKSLLFEELDPLIFAEFEADSIMLLNENLLLGKVLAVRLRIPQDVLSGDPGSSTIYISVDYTVPPYGVSTLTFNTDAISGVGLFGGSLNG